jgi:NAD+--asparagine ADP-ribosyltransferase
LVVRVFASRDGRRGIKGLGDKSREECRGVKGEVDPDGRVEQGDFPQVSQKVLSEGG